MTIYYINGALLKLNRTVCIRPDVFVEMILSARTKEGIERNRQRLTNRALTAYIDQYYLLLCGMTSFVTEAEVGNQSRPQRP